MKIQRLKNPLPNVIPPGIRGKVYYFLKMKGDLSTAILTVLIAGSLSFIANALSYIDFFKYIGAALPYYLYNIVVISAAAVVMLLLFKCHEKDWLAKREGQSVAIPFLKKRIRGSLSYKIIIVICGLFTFFGIRSMVGTTAESNTVNSVSFKNNQKSAKSLESDISRLEGMISSQQNIINNVKRPDWASGKQQINDANANINNYNRQIEQKRNEINSIDKKQSKRIESVKVDSIGDYFSLLGFLIFLLTVVVESALAVGFRDIIPVLMISEDDQTLQTLKAHAMHLKKVSTLSNMKTPDIGSIQLETLHLLELDKKPDRGNLEEKPVALPVVPGKKEVTIKEVLPDIRNLQHRIVVEYLKAGLSPAEIVKRPDVKYKKTGTIRKIKSDYKQYVEQEDNKS